MGLNLEYVDGQTPLDEDEKDGLRILSIATRGELDEFEQLNIENALLWILKRSFKHGEVFTDSFIKGLHKRMYGNVWKWAGQFRKPNKNIGVDKWDIPSALRNLQEDAKVLLENGTYPFDEFAIRFKHRLVTIHCFANGNGRHSRLMADIIIEKIFKKPVFTWGAANLLKQGEARSIYLSAIKQADSGNIQPLIDFARS